MKLPSPGPGLAPPRPRTRQQDRRRAAWLAVSALLHALVLIAVLVASRKVATMAQQEGAPSVEMVFEAPPTAAQSAAPQPADVPAPGENLLSPTAPPDETATQAGGSPAPAPAPAPAPQPAPPQPVAPPTPAPAPMPMPEIAAPAETAQVPPAPAPPVPAPPISVPVARALAPPSEPPAVRLDEPDALLLPPPMPVPEAPSVPPPPAPRVVQARPRPASNPFAGTLMLGGPLALQQPPGRPMRRSGAPSRAIDLSLGPVSAEPAVSGRYAAAHAAGTAKDWNSLFAAWFEEHKYYPADAAMHGEEGSSTVEMTVDRYGRVESASLVVGSGSDRLDAALLGTLRGAKVPPPLPGMPAPFTATVTLHYVLIR